MGAEITIEQVDMAAGTLSRAAGLASMPLADHQACIQAVQIIVQYIQQTKAARAQAEEKPKE